MNDSIGNKLVECGGDKNLEYKMNWVECGGYLDLNFRWVDCRGSVEVFELLHSFHTNPDLSYQKEWNIQS